MILAGVKKQETSIGLIIRMKGNSILKVIWG